MAMPTLFEITLPLLKLLGDGQEHTNKDIHDRLATEFRLTEPELEERVASGQFRFRNRVAWAKAELKMASLIDIPRSGCYRITTNGSRLLASRPVRIDRSLLATVPGYASHIEGRKAVTEVEPTAVAGVDSLAGTAVQSDSTPEETIDLACAQIRQQREQELLEKVKSCSPSFFEKLVVDLLLAMGYGGFRQGAGTATGKPGDGGIDGTIDQDPLGLDVVHVQAKRWEATVGRPELQQFAGALQGKQANKGVFITTSSFSDGAREYVRNLPTKIALVDGRKLAELLFDNNIGVSEESSITLKALDSDYFAEA